MGEVTTLNLALTVEEINVILGHLGNGSFNQVADLIVNIKKQAEDQLTPVTKEG